MDTLPVSTWASVGTYASYLAGAVAGLLGLGVWLRERRSWSHASFGVGMVALGLEAAFVAAAASSHGAVEYAQWQRWRLVPLAVAPVAWLVFSLSYSRGSPKEFLRRWRWVILVMGIAPWLALFTAWGQVVYWVRSVSEPADTFLAMGLPSYLLHLTLISGSVMALMNLERTFRAAVGTMRWRIKLVIVALVVLLVTRIYSSSQVLIYHSVDLRFEIINSAALLLAVVLIVLSFARTHVFGVDVYPSHAVLRSSLTVLLAGLYLVVVGVLAKVVGALGGAEAFPLQAFVVMVALAVLALSLMSDRMRILTQQFVSRHLRRPSYDYRDIWQTFAQKITPQVTGEGFSRAAARWLSETFEVLSASILWVDGQQRRLSCAASTVAQEGVSPEIALSSVEYEALLQWSMEQKGIRDLEGVGAVWARGVRLLAPAQFKEKGGNRHLLALVAGGELLGLVVLGDRVGGKAYTVEDRELLECLGDQLAASLLNIRLSERSIQAREMETLQTMATFFAHDLKNTASTLSLMLQNLPKHYDKPEFREDALKGLGRCVQRINELVGQLAVLRKGLDLKLARGDLNAVVGAALAPLEAGAGGRLKCRFQNLAAVHIDGSQIQKVVSNLVLNALEAGSPDSEVEVATSMRDGWAVLCVSDSGAGISTEFIRKSLFRPFQTTKKKGVGIGLFHSKAIVEGHGGRIEVESTVGQGSSFRVYLPMEGVTAREP